MSCRGFIVCRWELKSERMFIATRSKLYVLRSTRRGKMAFFQSTQTRLVSSFWCAGGKLTSLFACAGESFTTPTLPTTTTIMLSTFHGKKFLPVFLCPFAHWKKKRFDFSLFILWVNSTSGSLSTPVKTSCYDDHVHVLQLVTIYEYRESNYGFRQLRPPFAFSFSSSSHQFQIPSQHLYNVNFSDHNNSISIRGERVGERWDGIDSWQKSPLKAFKWINVGIIQKS